MIIEKIGFFGAAGLLLMTFLAAAMGAAFCGDLRKPTNWAHGVMTFALLMVLLWVHPALWAFALALVVLGAAGNLASAP